MGDFKVNKTKFSTGIDHIKETDKALKEAVTRTAAVDKKFAAAGGGAWLAAEALTAGQLETALRATSSGLTDMVSAYESAKGEIDGTLTSARDAVFSAADGHSEKPDWVALISGSAVSSGCTTVKDSIDKLKDTSNSIKGDCSGIEDAGAITGALDNLNSACDREKTKVQSIYEAWLKYVTAVNQFDSTYSGRLVGDKFFNAAKVNDAGWATASNMGLNLKDGIKSLTKIAKNYVSLFGEWYKATTVGGRLNPFDWVKEAWKKGGVFKDDGILKTLGSTFEKKLSESTHGILSRFWKEGKGWSAQGRATKIDIDQWKISRGQKVAKHVDTYLDAAKAAGKNAAKGPKVSLGSGLKGIGRKIGYVGDAIDIADTFVKAGRAIADESNGNLGQRLWAGGQQILKGVAKIGAGKLIGAAIGTAFGGPAGAVIGMAVGGFLTSWSDKFIEDAFTKMGTKTYKGI